MCIGILKSRVEYPAIGEIDFECYRRDHQASGD
jgi:hypothetical protein